MAKDKSADIEELDADSSAYDASKITVLEGLEAREEAEAVAAKLLAALREPIAVEELRLRVDASVGIALYPDDADDSDGLLDVADRTMYRAKMRGQG